MGEILNQYPEYSVLMSLYIKEKPEYLRESIDSMLNQTVKPDEIVVVEDGPLTEALYAVLDEYKKKYSGIVRTLRNEKNLGLGLALDAGLKACRNELVARMDTDDISRPERCEKQLAVFAKDPNLDIVGGNISEFIESVDNKVGKRVVPQTDSAIKIYLKKRCPFNHVTVMFKKSSVQKAGGYKDWFCNEDYFLWIRMFLAGMVFANIPEILTDVRVGKDMYRRRGGWKYFKSEAGIQWYMFNNNVISLPKCLYNIFLRLCLQVLMPNWVRSFVF